MISEMCAVNADHLMHLQPLSCTSQSFSDDEVETQDEADKLSFALLC
jgi:hypothetical protein